MQNIFRSVFALIVFIGICNRTLAQKDVKSKQFVGREIAGNTNNILKEKFHSFSVIQLSSKEIADYCKGGGKKKKLHLQAGAKFDFDLELEPSNLIAATYKLHILTPAGIKTLESKPDFLYKGKTKEGGQVRLAVKDGFISGSIHQGDKEYFIEPMSGYIPGVENDDFIFYETEDVIDKKLSCYMDNNQAERSHTQEKVGGTDSTQGSICKKARIMNMTDYSIYQHYGEDVKSVENFLLANLNNVEGVYTGFNFNPADSSDIGDDIIKFEITDSYISTCPTCDLVDSTNSWGSMVIQLQRGLFTNLGLTTPYSFVPHFWTMRDIRAPQPVLGAAGSGLIIMRHYSDDGLYLRLVAAHETGHYFNCQHDDEIKPGVRGFIMQAGASTSATRFSRLSDFGGVYYSSNLAIKQSILAPAEFSDNCSLPECETMRGLEIAFSNETGTCKISWANSGRFTVNHRLKQDQNFDPTTLIHTNDNSVTLTNLLPCSDYVIQVRKECGGSVYGASSFLYLNTANVQISNIVAANLRNELYDVSCHLSGTAKLINRSTITVDHLPVKFTFDTLTRQLYLNNLFADGARHRIDVTDSNNQRYCSGPFYFHAPYYRENSKNILLVDFNDCQFPKGWKDSVVQIKPDVTNKYSLFVAPNTEYTSFINQGNLDSTCLGSYNNPTAEKNGKLFFTSPEMDMSGFKNKLLNFDFNFVSIKSATIELPAGIFYIEAYDGSSWNKIFQYQKFLFIKPKGYYMSVWDTLLPRKFIPLDGYSNRNFKVRFVFDDGSYLDTNGKVARANVMLALDNIRIDGYSSSIDTSQNKITIFPNPANAEIFISSDQALASGLTYKITDLLGRECLIGELANNRIRLQNLKPGIYFLQIFKGSDRVATKKILKQ